jgi:hypothetical protein
MPPISKIWLPRFTGRDGERDEFHMNEFYSYFGLHPVDYDVEYVVMKFFPTTLQGNAKKWYDELLDASITSMNQLEEVFLKEWGMKLEEIQTLLKRLQYTRQAKNETVWNFRNIFEGLLYELPKDHYPEDKDLIYLFTDALLVHLGFLLSKNNPKTLHEAGNMALQIEENIFLSRIKNIFSLGSEINDLEKLVSLEISTDDFQEEGKQVIDQQNTNGKALDEVFQEKGIIENATEEMNPKQDDNKSTCPPPPNEAIHKPSSPTQQQDDKASFFPFQDFDDTLFKYLESDGEMESPNEEHFPCCTIKDEGETHEDKTVMHVKYTQFLKAPTQEEKLSYPPLQKFYDSLLYDLGKEEEMGEPLNVLNPPCYDTDTELVDIDEFIHVGRRRWDAVDYDMDPIYDIKSHLQVLNLQLSYQALDQWQQGDEIFTDAPQTPKADQVPYFPYDFQSYLEDFDDYSSEHLDLLYENDYQPLLCSGFNRSKNIVCLKKDSHDLFPQPPLIALPCCIIKGVVGNYIFYIEFPLNKTQESKGCLKTTDLSPSSQFFNVPLRVFQSSSISFSIPS